MSDQEQTARGASAVSNRGYWISQASLDDIAEREVQLRTDLERVTAERDAMREVCDLAPDALVILAGLHLGTTWELSPYVKDELARVTPLVRDALARLDATRKATDDATEEGK